MVRPACAAFFFMGGDFSQRYFYIFTLLFE
jgi:hypothetical protein